MVVHRYWLTLALLLLAPKLWAAALTVHFPASQLEVGRTVRVEISSPRPRPSLAGLDLSPWSPWLVLQRREDVVPNPAGGQTLVLWLVLRPAVAGRVSLPPLVLGALRSGVQLITIGPAIEGKGGEITPQFSSPPRQAWLRQQMIYTVSVVSRHRYLQLTSEPAELDGFATLVIPQQVESIGSGAGRRYRHTTGWLLFPSRPGRQRLQLPAVRYGYEGITSHRFYPPPLDLNIQALPDYLPPQLAVGRVELHGEHAWKVARSGELQTRHFSVVAHGVLPKWWRPPAIVVGDDAVHLYEAAPQLLRHIDAKGLTVRYRYALPLQVSDSGWHQLEGASRLYSFDPVGGKMQASELQVALPLSLYWWQEVLVGLSLVALLWFIGKVVWSRLLWRLRFLSAYRGILRQLQMVRGSGSLREVLLQVAGVEGWPANLSLQQWHIHWRRLQPKQQHLLKETWRHELERGLYAGGGCRSRDLADSLAQALRVRLGLWRWVCEFRL